MVLKGFSVVQGCQVTWAATAATAIPSLQGFCSMGLLLEQELNKY